MFTGWFKTGSAEAAAAPRGQALQRPGTLAAVAAPALLLVLALVLRLVVWRWREFYPLGGDEQEYLNQALTLLREWRYTELLFMRPPLYGILLASWIVLVDSLVQNLRLVQAVISALTVVPIWLLTAAVRDRLLQGRTEEVRKRRTYRYAPHLAALLVALNYTLAANATEMLTETVFLFGLAWLFWLLVVAGDAGPLRTESPLRTGGPQRPGDPVRPGGRTLRAGAAGLVLGLLALTRSVALPLLPLGVVWLLLGGRRGVRPAIVYALCALLVVLPWTTRNYITYGGLIVIDTTGAENLWLDNDPAGREAVKRQLYAMGDDRLARQQLAAERGIEVIAADPQRFAQKAGGELLKFTALEYSDDMRARQAIWISPAEVWARLVLGDAMWLLLMLGGASGLTLMTLRGANDGARGWVGLRTRLAEPAWLFWPWALYVVLTAMVFHVELRYRLPLYPVLLVSTALLPLLWQTTTLRGRLLSLVPAGLCLALLLLHRPYPDLAWQLAAKHFQLARAEQALARGDLMAARSAGLAALEHDEGSALAQVALARAALLDGNQAEAETWLRDAIAAEPAHAHAHLVLGDLQRSRGELEAAREHLAFETTSLQDLQRWSRQRVISAPPTELDIGGGLDLGFITGFHAGEAGGWRWTQEQAMIDLAAHEGATLQLRLAAGRPASAPLPIVEVLVNGQPAGQITVANEWQTYELALPAGTANSDTISVELRSQTFRPRAYDQASPDGRRLGVMVDRVRIDGQG